MKKGLVIVLLLFSLRAMAQEKIEITTEDYQNSGIEMADRMREDGKIYVLVGIIGIVFVGILVYLISTERKVSRLEKMMEEQD